MRKAIPFSWPTRRVAVEDLDFVGCERIRLTAAQVDDPEREGKRLEYWHAASETAWVVRDGLTAYHESPATRLAMLVERICLARGSAAVCIGNTDIRLRREDGKLGDFMQADQTVYLDPRRVENLPTGRVIVGESPPPDVILEVDHTTDVRPGKLLLYEAWGLPEVWVEVPVAGASSRRRGRRPGLKIYLLGEDGYQEASVSRAFPGWRPADIHRALNEAVVSEETGHHLWQVGRALGRRDGTRPEDDVLLRCYGERKFAVGHTEGLGAGMVQGRAAGVEEGHAAGMAEGRAAGLAEGMTAALAETARAILARRGVQAPRDLAEAVKDASPAQVVSAASSAWSEMDFRRRLSPGDESA